jgi:hypothetical protein
VKGKDRVRHVDGMPGLIPYPGEDKYPPKSDSPQIRKSRSLS